MNILKHFYVLSKLALFKKYQYVLNEVLIATAVKEITFQQ